MTTVAAQPAASSASAVHVALVGNPNTGKTTLFNRLTGVRQRVGNYPGVTVEKKQGSMILDGRSINIIDLPGAYGLVAESADERVVLDVLGGRLNGERRPDMVVCVCDATNLKRNLYLALQVAEIGTPMIVALNMIDEARDQGVHINHQTLSDRLGAPVIPISAARGEGVAELKQAIMDAIEKRPMMVGVVMPEPISRAADQLLLDLQAHSKRSWTGAEVRRLLFDPESSLLDDPGADQAAIRSRIDQARRVLQEQGVCLSSTEATVYYDYLDRVLEGVVSFRWAPKPTRSSVIDGWLTHRLFGLLFFTALMCVVFLSIYIGANPLMGAIETVKIWLQDQSHWLLAGAPMLDSLVADGMIEGVGAVVVFLPQILILFFFLALLEDSGYMARAAFLMDKLFNWCGLNGKCFVPMLSSFACAVPGILSARTIGDPKARLTTIMVAPLMSCSARLPVYVLLIGALIEPVYGPWWAGLALLGMHFLGLAVALPIAFVLNRFILKTKAQPFLLEMPPYRTPRLRDVLWRMWHKGSAFLKTAGTVIFAMTIVIWALLYFPHDSAVEQAVAQQFVEQTVQQRQLTASEVETMLAAEDEALSGELANLVNAAYVEQSYLGRTGRFVQPIFAPAGFDWKITVSVLAAFPAREVVVSTLGVIYRLGGDVDEESDTLREAILASKWTQGERAGQSVFTPLVAFSLMVFFALCSQCGSTLAVIARETSWRWSVAAFVYMTALAWLGAVVVYQVGSWIV